MGEKQAGINIPGDEALQTAFQIIGELELNIRILSKRLEIMIAKNIELKDKIKGFEKCDTQSTPKKQGR
jgi:hypothetical protein